jgi:hypothetical protein
VPVEVGDEAGGVAGIGCRREGVQQALELYSLRGKSVDHDLPGVRRIKRHGSLRSALI